MATIRKNNSVKAFTNWLSKNFRKEWEIACNTNSDRGTVYDHHELKKMFDRYGDCSNGASKAVHKLNYIVVKRHQWWGYCPTDEHSSGNQLIDEIECYKKYWDKPEADLLCPILKYFTSKSDKVTASSQTMQNNVLIVAQKAVKVGTAYAMCQKAYELNGFKGETPINRYEKMERFSKAQGWRDAMHNSGNSGVIYDYHAKCYKAVFIDYAL